MSGIFCPEAIDISLKDGHQGKHDDTTGYTEKVPPDTGYEWNEEQDDWVLKPVPEPEEPEEKPEAGDEQEEAEAPEEGQPEESELL